MGATQESQVCPVPYSNVRLRKSLALVRILAGLVFVWMGAYKVSSLDFVSTVFPDFLDSAIHGGAATWMRPLFHTIMATSVGKVGVLIGLSELFIGIALLLGLAVRPACFVGMLYSFGLLAATWNPVEGGPATMLRTAAHHYRNLFPLLVFWLLAAGHAGETWGLGALYHHHRARKFDSEVVKDSAPARAVRMEPRSFEELAEAEQQEYENFAQAEQQATEGEPIEEPAHAERSDDSDA